MTPDARKVALRHARAILDKGTLRGVGKVAHSCPLRTKLYGGLPSGGGFGSTTEFEVGAQRIAEAAHCLLGSLGRDVSGRGTWSSVVRAESGHIKEEFGIIEQVAKEYSKPVYRQRLTEFDDYLPQYREKVEKQAEKSVSSILQAAPKLIQTVKASAQDLIKQKDIPLPIANTAAAAYLVVKALAESMRNAVKAWPDHVSDPYSDRRLRSAITKLRQYVRKLFTTSPEVLDVPRKPDALKVAVVKKHPERGVYCLFDSDGEKALNCFEDKYEDEKPPKEEIAKAERIVQHYKHQASRVAAVYLARQWERPRYDTGRLTRMFTEDFPLDVPEMRFQTAVKKFARSVGGTYRGDGKVKLPHPPHELTVLYQKWYDQDGPRVAFTVFPTREGNRSKMFRIFEGPVKGSKRLFQKFVTWLGIIGAAIQEHAHGESDIAKRLRPSKFRVATRWREARGSLAG